MSENGGELQQLPAWLWVGLLLPPLAFFADLELGYVLAARACAEGEGWELLASSALAALLAAAGGRIAWRAGTRSQREQPHASEALLRAHRFLGFAGAALAGSALLLILAMALARVLPGCG